MLIPKAAARPRTLRARASRGRSEPLRICPPSASNSRRKSAAQDNSFNDGDRPSLTAGACSGMRHSLPVMPNSEVTPVASASWGPSAPTAGPSIGPGRFAAREAIVNWERVYARAAGLSPKPVSRR